MKPYLATLLLIPLLSMPLQASDTDKPMEPLIKLESAYGVAQTITRLENMLEEKGMTIFARINHAEGAKKADMELRNTELLIFGNPKVGTPLMQCDQMIGIELPQKALAWEDEAGKTWLAYNNPEHMTKTYQLDECKKVIQNVTKALGNFTKYATTKEQ